jgi:hypothetical protein
LLARKEAEEPPIRFVVSSVVDGKEINLAAQAEGGWNAGKIAHDSEIRRVLVTPDAKNPKPRPPLRPEFDGKPIRLIVDI